jgi:hypothetical protein
LKITPWALSQTTHKRRALAPTESIPKIEAKKEFLQPISMKETAEKSTISVLA